MLIEPVCRADHSRGEWPQSRPAETPKRAVHLCRVSTQASSPPVRIKAGPNRFQYGHDPAGLPVGQRFEQDSFHDAEDGRVGADPEGECEHGDGEKRGLSGQDTNGKANVLQNHIGSTIQDRDGLEEEKIPKHCYIQLDIIEKCGRCAFLAIRSSACETSRGRVA